MAGGVRTYIPARVITKTLVPPRRRRRTSDSTAQNESAVSDLRHAPGDTATSPGSLMARTLSAITEHARWDSAIRRGDLSVGDRLIVTTRNSTYSIWVIDAENYAVSGGWFDRQGLSPARIRINGCTYGQSVIRHDVLAGCGLFLEFGNNVLTTRIQQVKVIRDPDAAVCH